MGDAVTCIDRGNRIVHSASGQSVHYDRLLVATGSKPVAPPISGLNLPGVCAFRDIADVETMLAVSREHGRAVVIGGGLLGLEAAWGLKQRGMKVALVHLMPNWMRRRARCYSVTSIAVASPFSPTARLRRSSARTAPRA
jgi:nitrite reductase (NADH) large subunit